MIISLTTIGGDRLTLQVQVTPATKLRVVDANLFVVAFGERRLQLNRCEFARVKHWIDRHSLQRYWVLSTPSLAGLICYFKPIPGSDRPEHGYAWSRDTERKHPGESLTFPDLLKEDGIWVTCRGPLTVAMARREAKVKDLEIYNKLLTENPHFDRY